MDASARQPTAVTRAELAADLERLGVRRGAARDGALAHERARLGDRRQRDRRARAARRARARGTLLAYASWQDHVYAAEDWPAEHRDAYAADPPVFDVATGEVDRDYGRIPERVRTWPGARRSAHPEASVVAVGPRADWLSRRTPTTTATGPTARSRGSSRRAGRC